MPDQGRDKVEPGKATSPCQRRGLETAQVTVVSSEVYPVPRVFSSGGQQQMAHSPIQPHVQLPLPVQHIPHLSSVCVLQS